MPAPTHRIVAKNKQTKEYIDIGALFAAESGEAFSVLLEPGTVIKIASKYDKEQKRKVSLREPIYVKAEEFFVNVYPNRFASEAPAEHPVTKAVKKTFRDDDEKVPF